MSEFFRKPIVKTLMLKGQAGQSIEGIKKTSTSGVVDTYTITLTDGRTSTFNVTNGKVILGISKTGTNGFVDTYTITFNDGKTSTFTVTNGREVSSIKKTGTSGLVDTYTITFNDGATSKFTITNGKNGKEISSIKKTGTKGLVDTYTITFNDGATSTFTVTNGDGDYKPAVEALSKRIDNLILSSGTPAGEKVYAEVFDARVGYDRNSYVTLGDAIREQVGDIHGYLDQCSVVQKISLSDSPQDGYIQASNGLVVPLRDYAHTTKPIILKPKSTLYFMPHSDSYNDKIAVVAENIKGGNYFKPLLTGVENHLHSYEYTNNSNYDMDLCLSFPKKYMTDWAYIINPIERADSYFDYVKNNALVKNIEKIYPTRNVGKRINDSGSKIDDRDYFYSEPIELKKNDKVTLTSKDTSGTAVARMCLSDKDGNIISVLSLGTTQITPFTYTATNDCYIVLCAQKSNYDFYIIRERLNIPDGYINSSGNESSAEVIKTLDELKDSFDSLGLSVDEDGYIVQEVQ